MPRGGSGFSRLLVPDADQSVAFCGTKDDPPGEIVPTIVSLGSNGRARGNSRTRFIGDFV